MPTDPIDVVLLADPCAADGHPTSCTDPAPGTVELEPGLDQGVPITVDGTTVATRATTACTFGSHAHSYTDTDGDGTKECTDVQSHAVTTDQTHPITVDGSSVVFTADTTTDPGSGGTVAFTDDAGVTVVQLHE